jgi:hypothetical protein
MISDGGEPFPGKKPVMKSPKSTFCFKSFEEMKGILRAQSFSFPEAPVLSPRENEPHCPSPPPSRERASVGAMVPEQGPELEEKIFKEAMEGVAPIPRDIRVERGLPPPRLAPSPPTEETEPLLKLRDLVQHGMGFEVADTPEYIEGTMYQPPRRSPGACIRGISPSRRTSICTVFMPRTPRKLWRGF